MAVAQNDTTADTEQAYADATVISYDPNMQDTCSNKTHTYSHKPSCELKHND